MIPPDQFSHLKQVFHAQAGPTLADRHKRVGRSSVRPGRWNLHCATLSILEDEHLPPKTLAHLKRLKLHPSQRMKWVPDAESPDTVVHFNGSMSGSLTATSSGA